MLFLLAVDICLRADEVSVWFRVKVHRLRDSFSGITARILYVKESRKKFHVLQRKPSKLLTVEALYSLDVVILQFKVRIIALVVRGHH